jgi:Di- and tricarboxylate transporters
VAGSDKRDGERFAIALLLGIAYAASVGGIATLIGTPPNALLAAFLRENYDVHIGFGQWMLLGLPVSLGMLLFIWWWLTRGGFTLSGGDSRAMLEKEMAALGPMSKAEKMVAVVFSLAALAWVFQPLLAEHVNGVNDTSIAMAAALSLFLIPVDLRQRVFLMDWEQANKAPWGVLLLFGGGLSLAGVIGASGLAVDRAEPRRFWRAAADSDDRPGGAGNHLPHRDHIQYRYGRRLPAAAGRAGRGPGPVA